MDRTSWRLILAAFALGLLCTGSVLVTLRADAETRPSQAREQPAEPTDEPAIKDDPTVAPDPRESADNDVTFPTDI